MAQFWKKKPNFVKKLPLKYTQQFLLKSGSCQNSLKIWTTRESKFVARTFHKWPNLVTL